MPNENLTIVKANCNKCLHKTKHYVVAERKYEEHQPADLSNPYNEHTVSWTTVYKMLECCGCEDVCLQSLYYFSEADGVKEEYYPPQISRPLPRWLDELPIEWSELLAEVYSALHSDSRRLVLMGARALIDLYMNKQLGDVGGFAQKLNNLEADGLISKPHKEVLSAALELGHAATHRGHCPKPNEVNQVIDIVESLLQNDVFAATAKNLKAKTPKRGATSI